MNCDRVIYLGNGGLGSGKAGCLKAQDIDKFIPHTAFLKPFCFESWLLTSDPHHSYCQCAKEAAPCQGILAPLILVIHSTDRPKPELFRVVKETG